MIKTFSLDQLVRRNGGWSLIMILAVIQIVALLGAIPGLLSIRVNAAFDQPQVRIFSILVPMLIILTYLLLLAIGWWLTPIARKRLDGWASAATKPKRTKRTPQDRVGLLFPSGVSVCCCRHSSK